MHPAVVKAQHIARIADENGWKGTLTSEVMETRRITELTCQQDDEQILLYWINTKLDHGVYGLRGQHFSIHSSKEALRLICGFVPSWPEQMPTDEIIINMLIGSQLFWWDSVEATIRTDTVKLKRSNRFRIANVGHRKLFHFNGEQAGFRSVLLDTILKVA